MNPRRRTASADRASTLTDAQLARTLGAMAHAYAVVDPYRAAVLAEAAKRLGGNVATPARRRGVEPVAA